MYPPKIEFNKMEIKYLEIRQSSIYVIHWVARSIVSSTKRLMIQVFCGVRKKNERILQKNFARNYKKDIMYLEHQTFGQ